MHSSSLFHLGLCFVVQTDELFNTTPSNIDRKTNIVYSRLLYWKAIDMEVQNCTKLLLLVAFTNLPHLIYFPLNESRIWVLWTAIIMCNGKWFFKSVFFYRSLPAHWNMKNVALFSCQLILFSIVVWMFVMYLCLLLIIPTQDCNAVFLSYFSGQICCSLTVS